MSRVEEVEKAIMNLPPTELRQFRQWFASFDAEVWDARLESDADAGKLDTLADAAIAEHNNGTLSS